MSRGGTTFVTYVRTPDGDVPIHTLSIGAQVVTYSGEIQTVEWIGQEREDPLTGLYDNVEISTHALGKRVPAFPLCLSASQYVFLGGARVKVGYLVNDATICRTASSQPVSLLALDKADTLVLNNLSVDSFAGPLEGLANHHQHRIWYPIEKKYPFQRGGYLHPQAPMISEIRSANILQAEKLGYHLTSNPNVGLLVNGESIRCDQVGRDTFTALVKGTVRQICLTSRVAVPADLQPEKRDIRRLGIAVREIILDNGGGSMIIKHDEPMLSKGFYRPERDWRWTDGCAEIPIGWIPKSSDKIGITIRVASTPLRYLAKDSLLVRCRS